MPFYFPDWLVLRELSRDVQRALTKHARGRLLDVGCGEKPYARLAPPSVEWVGLDDSSNTRADVHGTAASMPFPDGSFDTVLCTQVIEHVPEPRDVLAECARVLRARGVLILTAPQYWEVHESPLDYYRFTPLGLARLVEGSGLSVVETIREGTGIKVGAQALNLSIQHWGEDNIFGRCSLARAAKVPFYALNNVGALIASAFIASNTDALNLMLIANKT